MAILEMHYEDSSLSNCLILYSTEAELRSMGPVDTQVYLEEMSWNKGWILVYFVVSTLKRNIRVYIYLYYLSRSI